MSEERILEIIESQDKNFVLGFIRGLIANTEELREDLEEYKKMTQKWHNKCLEKDKKIIQLERLIEESRVNK